MGFTAEDLSRALGVCCGEPADGPAEQVALVRAAQPAFAATLYSAWQSRGDDIGPGLGYELDTARARLDRYRQVAAALRDSAPGLVPIKGLEVAALYPDGLVRAMNDLDYVAPAEADLWPAVAGLLADGWDLHTATFSWFDGRLQVLVSLRREHEDRYALPYGVEFASYAAAGDDAGVPPLARLAPAWLAPPVKNTLMLLYERFEQPYRARDLIDAVLLHEHASAAQRADLAAAVDRLGLWPEYAELAALVRQAELGPLPVPPAPVLAGPRALLRRGVRGAALLRRPLAGTARHLQRRMVNGSPHRPEQQLWALAQRRLSAADAVRAGLMAFGLPLDTPAPAVPAAVLRRDGALSWVDTPVARFLLTIGDDVTEQDVARLSGPAPAGSRPPAAVAEPRA